MMDADAYGRMVAEVAQLRHQVELAAAELVQAYEARRTAEESLGAVVGRLDERGLANVLLYVAMRAGLQGRDFTAAEAAEVLRAYVLDEVARPTAPVGMTPATSPVYDDTSGTGSPGATSGEG